MGKEVPDYKINFNIAEEERQQIKALILKWYVDLAIEQISQLDVQQRKLLIEKLKLNH